MLRPTRVLMLIVVLSGCGGERDRVSTSAAARSSSAETSLDDRLEQGHSDSGDKTSSSVSPFGDVRSLWKSGQKDDAIQRLTSIPWDDPGVFADTPIMNISEQEFMGLAREDRTLLQNEAIALTNVAVELRRHAFALAEEASVSGNTQLAGTYYEAVLQLGEALSSPDHLMVLQLLGKSIVSQAQQELAGLNR